MAITLTAINATISDERRNVDLPSYIKDAAMIKASQEFRLLANRAAVAALNGLHEVEDVLGYVEAAMVMALRIGYRIKEQEIGAQELEVFFNEQLG